MKKMYGNKKGFTLVELVVVIAILAILAAIAIPAVIGIISSASESQSASDAATLDSACKTYFGGLVSGSIHSGNFTPVHSDDVIPGPLASTANKKMMARSCTVAGAMEYSGIYDRLIDRTTDFGYDQFGNIGSLRDQAVSATLTQLPSDAKITFSDIGYVWDSTDIG